MKKKHTNTSTSKYKYTAPFDSEEDDNGASSNDIDDNNRFSKSLFLSLLSSHNKQLPKSSSSCKCKCKSYHDDDLYYVHTQPVTNYTQSWLMICATHQMTVHHSVVIPMVQFIGLP